MRGFCGMWSERRERVAFSDLRAMGRELCESGSAECFLARGIGLWQSGGALAARQGERGSVVALLRAEDEENAPSVDCVLGAYLAYGVAFFCHLFGSYAVAVFDGGAGRIVLARDDGGRVPLLYAYDGGRLCFFSSPSCPSRLGTVPLPAGGAHVFSSVGHERLSRCSPQYTARPF